MTETTDPAVASPETTADRPLRLETLVYLYGDLFVRPLAPGKKGMRCYASGTVVPRESLAICMNAAVLASLHCREIIRLEAFTKRLLGAMPVHGVSVTVTGDLSASGYNTPLVGAIGCATREPNGKGFRRIAGKTFSWLSEPIETAVQQSVGATVKHVVADTLVACDDPFGTILQHAIDEAVESGYLTRHQTREHLRKHTTLEPVVSRIKSLKQVARALADDWDAFSRADEALFKAVMKDTSNGILSQRKDNDNEWGLEEW